MCNVTKRCVTAKGFIVYIQSFNRYETKYLIDDSQKAEFITKAGKELVRDKYGEYTICNIYLDTDDFYFIEHSLDKPVYKEKLRIRSYGTVGENDEVFFEIKKKYRGIVYKRRITIPLWEAMEYIEEDKKPESLSGYSCNQIFEEIDFLMKKYKPVPKLFLAYDRVAYADNRFNGFRVTFDKGIRGSWNELTLTNDKDNTYLDTGKVDYNVMEIKCTGAMPLEYTRILSEMKIYPVSFSKYGRIYTEKHNARKMEVCYE